MLPRAFHIVAGLLLAGAPFSVAGTPVCYKSPSHDETAKTYALKDGTYFYVGSDPTLTGFWHESNNRTGLQVHNCVSQEGQFLYAADKFDGTQIPSGQLL